MANSWPRVRIPQTHHAMLTDHELWRCPTDQFGDDPTFANGTVAGKRAHCGRGEWCEPLRELRTHARTERRRAGDRRGIGVGSAGEWPVARVEWGFDPPGGLGRVDPGAEYAACAGEGLDH